MRGRPGDGQRLVFETIEEIEMTRKQQSENAKSRRPKIEREIRREQNGSGAIERGSSRERNRAGPAAPRQQTRHRAGALGSPRGRDARLAAVTDWLPHTTRAALTGLRKRGYAVTSEKTASDGAMTSLYRIHSAGAA